jgi:hypothetical protein
VDTLPADVRRSPLHFVVLALPFVGLALLAVLWIATEPDPRGYGTHEQLGFAPCGLRERLGGPCPTCGVTTSASHLVHGDVALSWSVQPFGTIASLATVVFALLFVVLHRRGGDLGLLAIRHGAAFWFVVGGLLLLCWLA